MMKRSVTIAFVIVVLCGMCLSQDMAPDYALLEAVARKNYDGVKKALDDGANIDVAMASGTTPLMFATKYSDAPMVRLLMLRGANRNIKNNDGKTALDLAKEAKNNEIVKIIQTTESVMPQLRALEQYLKTTPSPASTPPPAPAPEPKNNTAGSKSSDPADVAAMFRTLADWPNEHNTFRITNLLSKGVDPNARDAAGRTPLMYVVAYDDEGALTTVLIKKGANVDAQNDEGRTALMEAVSHKRPFSVFYLLAAGAKTDLKDKRGKTAYDIAVEVNDALVLTLVKPLGPGENVAQDPPASASKNNKPELIAMLFRIINYRKDEDNRGS